MLRFQRNPGFKLLSPRRFQPRGRFANFQVCLFVKLAAGLFLQNSAFFNLFTAVASEMTAHWFSNFFQVIFYFVCLFVCLFVKLAYLSPISPNSNDMVPISRNLKKGTCCWKSLKCSNFTLSYQSLFFSEIQTMNFFNFFFQISTNLSPVHLLKRGKKAQSIYSQSFLFFQIRIERFFLAKFQFFAVFELFLFVCLFVLSFLPFIPLLYTLCWKSIAYLQYS